MTRIFMLSAGISACLTTSLAAVRHPLDLKTWLERPLLAPDQTQSEVQSYVETRLPPLAMPMDPTTWQEYASRLRRDVLDRVVFRGDAAGWRDAPGRVEWLDSIDGGPGYHMKKLRYEAVPGLWIPAILYEPDELNGKVPVIMNVNGHDINGKAAKYKQIRCINLAKRGMIVLNPEWLGMGQLSGDGYRHGRMNQLDLCGASGLAPFYLSMKRGLDVLLAHEHADPSRVAVSGLSGGGWQTITISALDPRVTLCNPVAGYSSFRTRVRNFSDLGDSEQTPCDLATVADYEHLTAMLAPRPALLTFNANDDCCFAADHALPPLTDAARPVYRMYGKELSLRSHVNYHPGTHNYEIENREALYRMIGDFFFAGQKYYDSQEVLCDDEVKTKEQLNVELPPDNATFHTLAQAIAERLESTRHSGNIEPSERRERLAGLVRAKQYEPIAEKLGTDEKDGVMCSTYRIKMSGAWTVPVVEFTRGSPKKTVVTIADAGRTASAQQIERMLVPDSRVIAADLFYFGECKIQRRDYLFALLIATVGDRALGVQCSQLAAIARWASSSGYAVTIDANGPRSSIISLVAAGLERTSIDGVELHDARWKLSDVIGNNHSFEQSPELFCFGLLQEFDSDQLMELAGTERVHKN